MKIVAIGLGHCGGRIVDAFVEREKREPVKCFIPLNINTSRADLASLTNIPDDSKLLIGESTVKGHGVSADNKLGAKIAFEELDKIKNAIDRAATTDIDAFLLVTGLGGGTGSGAFPVVGKALDEAYDEPVYGLGVLPAREEGDIYTLNAARSIKTAINVVDGTILVDNATFMRGVESVSRAYDEINREVVRRFGLLARAGETAFQTGEMVGENVVDASEVLYTIGRGGITSLGYASERIKKEIGLGGLFRRKKPEFGSMGEAGKATRIIGLVRRAVRGKLTIECDHTSAERALVLVSGPPEYLTRRGTDKARKWLEDEIVGSEIRGGDYPIPGADAVAVVVALSGLTEVPRIKEMFEHASEVKEKLERAHEVGRKRFDELMEKGDVDTLF